MEKVTQSDTHPSALNMPPASGVMRHADAGYPVARHAAAKHQLNLPMLAKKWP